MSMRIQKRLEHSKQINADLQATKKANLAFATQVETSLKNLDKATKCPLFFNGYTILTMWKKFDWSYGDE